MPPEDNQQPQMPGQQFAPQTDQPEPETEAVAPEPAVEEAPTEVAPAMDATPAEPMTEPMTTEPEVADTPVVEAPAPAEAEPVDSMASSEPAVEEAPAEVAPELTPEVPPIVEEPAPVEAPVQEAPAEPIMPEVTPAPAMPMQPDPTAMAAAPTLASAGGGKKALRVIVFILLALAAVGIAAAVYMFVVLGGAPKYSSLKEVTLEGYSTDPTGVKFKVPEEFEIDTDSSTRATYYDYATDVEDEQKTVAPYAVVATDVNSLYAFDGLSDDDVKEVLAQLEEAANNNERLQDSVGFGGDSTSNVKLSTFTKDESAGTANMEVTFDMELNDITTNFVMKTKVMVSKPGFVYSYSIIATPDVWEANSGTFDEMFNSVQIDQEVEQTT